MSTIYNNFGVDFQTNKSDSTYKIISKTGEELRVSSEFLQSINFDTQANIKKDSSNGYMLDDVYADFKNAGHTDKISNFYTLTLNEISKKNDVSIYSLYSKKDNKILITDKVIELINETLPNSVRFQNPVVKKTNKYVSLLIGA